MQGGRNRGAHGMGGCHHCSGTSKDSSADVSKQDGCQVSLVNYLSNKKEVGVYSACSGPCTALRFFFAVGTCFSPIFELALSFLNESEAFYLDVLKYIFDHMERSEAYLL